MSRTFSEWQSRRCSRSCFSFPIPLDLNPFVPPFATFWGAVKQVRTLVCQTCTSTGQHCLSTFPQRRAKIRKLYRSCRKAKKLTTVLQVLLPCAYRVNCASTLSLSLSLSLSPLSLSPRFSPSLSVVLPRSSLFIPLMAKSISKKKDGLSGHDCGRTHKI